MNGNSLELGCWNLEFLQPLLKGWKSNLDFAVFFTSFLVDVIDARNIRHPCKKKAFPNKIYRSFIAFAFS